MAESTFLMALAMDGQTVKGTPESNIDTLTGPTVASSDGLILGDPSAGEGESGISFALARKLREKAVVTNSFTVQPSDFLGVDIATFSVTIPLKGNGATATPADAEYKPLPGIHALLEACGWSGANWGGGGDGYIYTPAEPTIATAKIWMSNSTNCVDVVLKDVTGSWEITQTPGDIGLFTATLSGVWHSTNEDETTPTTFDYTTQSSLSTPAVQGLTPSWSVTRNFTSCTVTGDNQTESFPRSNSATGEEVLASGRAIDIDISLIAEDTVAQDFELQQLELTATPTNALTWTVGTAAGATDTINAYTLNFPSPEVRSVQANKSSKQVWDLNLRAVDTTANTEAELIFV